MTEQKAMIKGISRREALKRIGAFAVLAALDLTSMSALTSCAPKKRRIVFYFTASSNSLFVAKILSDSPLSIPQELKKYDLVYEADEIGFVFPDYAASAPLIVREFIGKAHLKAPYIFSVITFGNFACNVCAWWDRYAKEKGLEQNYIKSILMVDNYLPVFDIEQQLKIDKHTDESLATIIEDLDAHKNYKEEGELGFFREEDLARLQAAHFPMTSEHLLEIKEDKCVSCGFCTKVCPRGNFKFTETGIKTEGSCEHCLACVHNCPQKAIVLRNGERNPDARYRHPKITINEIVQANIK